MRKKMLFSMMLMAGLTGGFMASPTPVMASVSQAQTIKVSGQIVDQDGQPLIGATVKVKNAKLGVVTDFDGNFTIDVASDGVLVVSYVGYKDREIAVRGRAALGQIQLEDDSNMLSRLLSSVTVHRRRPT